VVEKDAHLAIGVLLVTERILNFGLAAICGTGEVVVAHGDGDFAGKLNLVIVEDDF